MPSKKKEDKKIDTDYRNTLLCKFYHSHTMILLFIVVTGCIHLFLQLIFRVGRRNVWETSKNKKGITKNSKKKQVFK